MNNFEYNFRYDHSKQYLKQQNINYENENNFGKLNYHI